MVEEMRTVYCSRLVEKDSPDISTSHNPSPFSCNHCSSSGSSAALTLSGKRGPSGVERYSSTSSEGKAGFPSVIGGGSMSTKQASISSALGDEEDRMS